MVYPITKGDNLKISLLEQVCDIIRLCMTAQSAMVFSPQQVCKLM